jgi:hypothetical protein
MNLRRIVASAAIALIGAGCVPASVPAASATVVSTTTAALPLAPSREPSVSAADEARAGLRYPYNLPEYTGGLAAALQAAEPSAEGADASMHADRAPP